MLNPNYCTDTWTVPKDCIVLHVIVYGQPTDLFLQFCFFNKELHRAFEWKLFEGIQSLCTFGIQYQVSMDCWDNGISPLNKYGWTYNHLFPKGHYVIKYIYKNLSSQKIRQIPSLSTFAAIVIRTNLLTNMVPPGIINLFGVHRHTVINSGNELDPPTCNLSTCAYQKLFKVLNKN
jgi:hypothetical protein